MLFVSVSRYLHVLGVDWCDSIPMNYYTHVYLQRGVYVDIKKKSEKKRKIAIAIRRTHLHRFLKKKNNGNK